MTPTHVTSRPQPERQMEAARQIRAETMARGFARAVEALVNVAHRLLKRVQGLVHPQLQQWPRIHQRTARV